jgi:anti-sigma28 factor (negative regulator of flagellin synthesis)
MMKASDRKTTELKALADLPDEQIDTSDIAEQLDWNGAVRGRFRRASVNTPPRKSADRKFEIIRLLEKGMSSSEIANILGIGREHVSAIKAHIAKGTYAKDGSNTPVLQQTLSPAWLNRLQARRKSGAQKKGISFELIEPDFIAKLYEQQGRRCAVSGVKFNLERHPNALVKYPFAPSIDRKLSTGGYTKENVRLVCVAVNFGLNQWGDEVFLAVARGAVACESQSTSALADVGSDAKWEAELRERITTAEELLRLLPAGLQRWQRKHIAGLKSALTKGLAGSRGAAEKAVRNRDQPKKPSR